jgi:hypothetical protein
MASRWKDVADGHVELGAQMTSLDLLTMGLRYSYCLLYPSLERPTIPMRSLSRRDDHFPLDTRASCRLQLYLHLPDVIEVVYRLVVRTAA